MKNILVTGGMGYIGSHTVVELAGTGYFPVIIDNLTNSKVSVLKRIEKITGSKIPFVELDVRDTKGVIEVIEKYSVDAVIHFAAFKAVGESSEKPLLYYKNNLGGLLSLIQAMDETKIKQLIFSSSATVYGDPDSVPIYENDQLKETTNPYGETKKVAERIIQDVTCSSDIKSVILRYFNPIGAHASGLIGENPQGTPNNLVPYLVQAVAGIRSSLTVFGDDYDTPDGTGIRDYIHVVDLAKAHVKSLDYFKKQTESSSVFNIGTGKGTSVFELISAFEKVNGVKVPYSVGPRRSGDIASCYASAKKAEDELGWTANLSLEDALRDSWRWQVALGQTQD